MRSDKFGHSEKVHLRAVDQLRGFSGGEIQPGLGRVHFSEKRGIPYQYIPHMKCDVPRPGDGRSQEFELGKKFIDFVAKEKPPRPELKHLKEGVSGHVEDVPYGIRTFPEIRCEKRHELEEMMGKKGRIEYLQQMRNGLEAASLGDKPYKHPDYCSDFFKEGGLVAGSSNIQRKVNINQLHEKEMEKKIKLIQSKIRKGTTWAEKVKQDSEKEKQTDIQDLDRWIETTLKPSNPNYQDPDKFFENLEKQQQLDPKKAQAAAKKGGKK